MKELFRKKYDLESHMKRKLNKRGFTLVDIITIIVILALIVLLVMPIISIVIK